MARFDVASRYLGVEPKRPVFVKDAADPPLVSLAAESAAWGPGLLRRGLDKAADARTPAAHPKSAPPRPSSAPLPPPQPVGVCDAPPQKMALVKLRLPAAPAFHHGDASAFRRAAFGDDAASPWTRHESPPRRPLDPGRRHNAWEDAVGRINRGYGPFAAAAAHGRAVDPGDSGRVPAVAAGVHLCGHAKHVGAWVTPPEHRWEARGAWAHEGVPDGRNRGWGGEAPALHAGRWEGQGRVGYDRDGHVRPQVTPAGFVARDVMGDACGGGMHAGRWEGRAEWAGRAPPRFGDANHGRWEAQAQYAGRARAAPGDDAAAARGGAPVGVGGGGEVPVWSANWNVAARAGGGVWGTGWAAHDAGIPDSSPGVPRARDWGDGGAGQRAANAANGRQERQRKYLDAHRGVSYITA